MRGPSVADAQAALQQGSGSLAEFHHQAHRVVVKRIVIFPIATLLGTTRWTRQALAEIRAAGTPLPIMDQLPRFGEFLDFIGLPEIHELERRFRS